MGQIIKKGKMQTNKFSHIIKKALEGDIEAQYLAGCYYAQGKEIAQDVIEAMDWFYQAADSNHIMAMYSLGLIYFYNPILDDEDQLATYWLSKAQSFGCELAKDVLKEIEDKKLINKEG